MKQPPIAGAAGLLMLLGSIGTATAQGPPRLTPQEAASRWGLIGTWKVDCAAPTTKANPALTYVVRDGKLQHDHDFADVRRSGIVNLVLLEQDGSAEVSVSLPEDLLRYTFIKDAGGRIRLIYINDFKTGPRPTYAQWLEANPDQARWQTRCH